MKRCVLRPRAREDRREEVLWYRRQAGEAVALRLVDALSDALDRMSRYPSAGSTRLALELGVPGLRTWRILGFPLAFWCLERADHVEVVRLVGQRQDPLGLVDLESP